MQQNKYVIVKVEDKQIPILFPDLIPHRKMAYGGKPVSAGFFGVKVADNKLSVWVYGDSETLHLSSRPEDSDIIEKFLLKQS